MRYGGSMRTTVGVAHRFVGPVWWWDTFLAWIQNDIFGEDCDGHASFSL